MNVKFHTLGCKVNQYETQVVAQMFKDGGHTSDENLPYDVFVVNSCTVTAESDRKTRQAIHKFRRENSNAIIILFGCFPQAFKDKAAELVDADIVLGNTSAKDVYKYFNEYLKTKERIVNVKEHTKDEKYNTPCICSFSERTRAYMKIEDGCERYCSYCIIPFSRGRVRSKALSEIANEAEVLANAGYTEIVLVGINLSAYGSDLGLSICDAVEAVSKISGIKRVRLGSLEPDHITDKELEILSKNEKFCPQFHLSLQSGSDATLKRMNRHYDTAFYYDLILRIRKAFKNPSITTDIMVGFAGETEQEFKESLAFAKKCGFAKAHVFAYSRRSGTFADSLKDQVSESVKQERSKQMIKVCKDTANEFLLSQVNLNLEVLFETEEDGYYNGYSKNYLKVRCKSEQNLCHTLKTVKITAAQDGYLEGEIL